MTNEPVALASAAQPRRSLGSGGRRAPAAAAQPRGHLRQPRRRRTTSSRAMAPRRCARRTSTSCSRPTRSRSTPRSRSPSSCLLPTGSSGRTRSSAPAGGQKTTSRICRSCACVRRQARARRRSGSSSCSLAPPQYEAGGQEKTNQRVHTRAGELTIPSFTYLALAEWKPIETHHGVPIARPEMMALANMLHHPSIREDLMRDAGDWKRLNKDLGRVLAMAHLTLERDRREGTDEFDQWAQRMWDALQEQIRRGRTQAGDGRRHRHRCAAGQP